jgi:hypothetical protein
LSAAAEGHVRIVGVDCATKSERTGVTVGDFDGEVLTIQECGACEKGTPPERRLFAALRDSASVLLALDSPLGWPSALGRNLVEHEAGRPISDDSDTLFRRRTDKAIREKLGKTPLEVGADRIARTARAALSLIGGMEELLGRDIPLAWSPGSKGTIEAIEVYPAGTLRAYELLGYVAVTGIAGDRKVRLLEALSRSGRLAFGGDSLDGLANEHALDSVLCSVAGADFLQGKSISPPRGQERVARKEGWIWVRDPG